MHAFPGPHVQCTQNAAAVVACSGRARRHRGKRRAVYGAPARPDCCRRRPTAAGAANLQQEVVLFVQVERRRGVGRTHEDICARADRPGATRSAGARKFREFRASSSAAYRDRHPRRAAAPALIALDLREGSTARQLRAGELTIEKGASDGSRWRVIVNWLMRGRRESTGADCPATLRAPPGAAVAAGGGRTDCGGS